MSGISEHKIEIGGVTLNYLRAGEGADLVIIHGWKDSSNSFRFILPELAKDYRVTAFDLPGHGQSSLPPEHWATEDISKCILAALAELGISGCHCMAHSVGGRVTIRMALIEPKRFSKLILIDSSGIKPPRPLKYHLKVAVAKVGKFAERYLGPLGASLKAAIYSRIASRDYLSAGPLRSIFVRIVNEDLKPLLHKISHPTLLIWGEKDQETPLSSGETMAAEIKNSELVVFEGAGHYPFVDQTTRFLLTVKRFLRS